MAAVSWLFGAPMKSSCTWIVVADDSRTRILAHYSARDRFYPVFGGEFEHPSLEHITEFLEQTARQERFDRLILTARQPHLDGLRLMLGRAAAGKLVREVPESLGLFSDDQIASRLLPMSNLAGMHDL
jgi:hypothetical protein